MGYAYRMNQLLNNPEKFVGASFGLEKENLRIKEDGTLDLSPHPVRGDDPYRDQIIRDFSESQVEFVTQPHKSVLAAFEELKKLQDHFLGNYDVQLWPLSMPCYVKDEDEVPIASYDDSEEGRKARLYREGLADKHGKKMQLISGIHYNFSFGEEALKRLREPFYRLGKLNEQTLTNNLYFRVARNMIRYQWFLTYLFGASPSVDSTYKSEVVNQLKGIEHLCKKCQNAHTYYEDYATSLRMSRYGYHSQQQEGMYISYDNLEAYIDGLEDGIKHGVLQKESEYYAPIRFKQPKGNHTSLLRNLEQYGVGYIELRCFDLNPFTPYNMTLEQLYFTHIFILYMAMLDSPNISCEEMDQIYRNNQKVSIHGRKPSQKISYLNQEWSIDTLCHKVSEDMTEIAEALDKGSKSMVYTSSLKAVTKNLSEQGGILSERMMNELLQENMTYIEQGLKYSKEKERYIR